MRILITGAKGQLGAALAKTLARDELYLVDLPQLDLTLLYATLDIFRLSRLTLPVDAFRRFIEQNSKVLFTQAKSTMISNERRFRED